MRDLAKRLEIPLAHAVGIMEMIWHWAGQNTPEGDIGIAADREIAAAADWEGKTSQLIEGLVSSGWLDPDPDHRLIIHDWPDHADNAVKKFLDRGGKTFLPVYGNSSGQCPDKLTDKVQTDDWTESSPRAHVRAGFGLAVSSEDSSTTEPKSLSSWKRQKFDEFWAVCWNRTGKEGAWRSFEKCVKTPTIADQIIAAARVQGPGLIEHARRYQHSLLHPKTWLNNGRYLDEVTALSMAGEVDTDEAYRQAQYAAVEDED